MAANIPPPKKSYSSLVFSSLLAMKTTYSTLQNILTFLHCSIKTVTSLSTLHQLNIKSNQTGFFSPALLPIPSSIHLTSVF